MDAPKNEIIKCGVKAPGVLPTQTCTMLFILNYPGDVPTEEYRKLCTLRDTDDDAGGTVYF